MLIQSRPKAVGQIFLIDTHKIVPNKNQPRNYFDSEEIYELSKNIKKNGIIQPLTVRRVEENYELIAGERRLRAAKAAGMSKVPCIIMDIDDKNSAVFALIENIQRKDLNFIEEGKAIQRLITTYGIKQEDIAQSIGKSQSAVSNLIRILQLSPDIQRKLTENNLTHRHARALLKLSEKQREEAITYIIEKKLNVQQTDEYVEKLSARKEEGKKERRRKIIFFKDVKVFVNTINHAVEVMQQAGIQANCQRTEDDDGYTFIVKVPRYKE